jgi:hypothetical protein
MQEKPGQVPSHFTAITPRSNLGFRKITLGLRIGLGVGSQRLVTAAGSDDREQAATPGVCASREEEAASRTAKTMGRTRMDKGPFEPQP